MYHSSSSWLAVDGRSATNFFIRSCTHTQFENKAWWRVDLLQVEPVSEVYIVNRGDCCGQRLNNFEILVGKLALLLILIYRFSQA